MVASSEISSMALNFRSDRQIHIAMETTLLVYPISTSDTEHIFLYP